MKTYSKGGINLKYTLGLDIGIASIGWATIGLDEEDRPTHIFDTGVIVVESMEDKSGNLINEKRRGKRGARRTLRRRRHRVDRMYNLLANQFAFSNKAQIYEKVNTNIYEIKATGLKQELTEEQLSAALLHYCKHRGFKSNRKSTTNKEDGKVLEAIKKNKDRLGDKYISELLFEELDGKNKIKNTGGSYNYSFDRAQYEKEITHLLEVQQAFHNFDDQFVQKCLEIWASQRDFSDGPGGESDYKVDFAKVFGYCKFESDQLRAPKNAYSQEINSVLGKLINLRYRLESETTYQSLQPEEIKQLVQKAQTANKLTYSDVVKILKKGNLKFKGLVLSKSDYIKCLKACKVKDENGNTDVKSPQFKEDLLKEEYKKVIFEMKGNNALKKAFKNNGGLELYNELPAKYKDDIAVGLTFYKTDERIANYFRGVNIEDNAVVSELDWDLYPQIVNEIIPIVDDSVFKEAGALSLKVLHKLNVKMNEGVEYSQAMAELGYDHSNFTKGVEKLTYLLPIQKILDEQYPNEVSNPRVVRVLTKAGSLINSCIDKWGMPYFINVEVARDINLKLSGRTRILNEQLENLTRNERIKAHILADNHNKSYSQISRYDIENINFTMSKMEFVHIL